MIVMAYDTLNNYFYYVEIPEESVQFFAKEISTIIYFFANVDTEV